jgi:hypothetical protein
MQAEQTLIGKSEKDNMSILFVRRKESSNVIPLSMDWFSGKFTGKPHI